MFVHDMFIKYYYNINWIWEIHIIPSKPSNKILEFPQIKGGLYYEEKWTIQNPFLKTPLFLSIAHSFFPKSSPSLPSNSQTKPNEHVYAV